MARYLIGIVLMFVAFVPLCLGVHRLRRALLPGWNGPPALLAEVAAILTSIVAVTQVLGVLGVYRLAVATIVYSLLGVGLVRLARGRTASPAAGPGPRAPSILGPRGNWLAAVVIGFVAGPWSARAAGGFSGGVPGADTLWYHLPTAGRLVQTGSLQEITYFDPGNLTAFYPNASTFFHATGMLFLQSDILSPIINHGWLAVALLAAWCLGRPFGVAPLTLMAISIVLSSPGLVGHQAGSAMNDIATLALVLCAIALLATARTDRLTGALPVIGLAGAVTGIALATKWTAVPTTGALTLGVLLLAPAGKRVRVAGTWLLFSGFTGAFTFVRNLIEAGNPVPPINLRLGPIGFDAREADGRGYSTIRNWLTDDAAWSQVFRPGLDLWLGPLWWFVLALALTGLLAGLFRGDGRVHRLVAAVGLVGLLGYINSPQFLELFGLPHYFLSNLRYAVVGLGLGLVAVPLLPFVRRGRRGWAIATALCAVMLASASTSRLWTGVDDWRFQDRIDDSDTLAGIAAGLLIAGVALAVSRRDRPDRVLLRRFAIGGGALLLVAGVGLRATYLEHRYADAPFWNPAVDLTDARIAMDGINTQFMMYGPDLSNHVQWVGRIDDGVFAVIESCEEWRTAINEGRYTHAIFGPTLQNRPGAYQWILDDPAAELVQEYEGSAAEAFSKPDEPVPIAFFRITGPLDPSGCG